eukprot:6193517-Pleurochrysis_carterae.AAC.2
MRHSAGNSTLHESLDSFSASESSATSSVHSIYLRYEASDHALRYRTATHGTVTAVAAHRAVVFHNDMVCV